MATTVETIVAKRAGSEYRSGERCADWVKWHANRGQEFVIGGYTLNGSALDSILVGYYARRDLMYAASVRAGIPTQFPPGLAASLRGAPDPTLPVRKPA
jgi:ATP-dependent DNA ligase